MDQTAEDRYWLKQRMPQATAAQVERFCERVAVMVEDPYPGSYLLQLGRGQALEAIRHDYGPA